MFFNIVKIAMGIIHAIQKMCRQCLFTNNVIFENRVFHPRVDSCICICRIIEIFEYDFTNYNSENRHPYARTINMMIPCSNFSWCSTMISERIARVNNGLCHYCSMKIGHIYDGHHDECPICFYDKNLISLECNHELCFTCFLKICETDIDRKCPICRTHNE